MNTRIEFEEDAQADLLSAAVRFYEVEEYQLCMNLLHVLMVCGNKESYVLAGHCISESGYMGDMELSNQYYKVSCEMGSAVGCYNLYLNNLETDREMASKFLKRAKDLGWVDLEDTNSDG